MKNNDLYGTITLTGMEFHAFHGCLEQEKRDGGIFLVDLEGRLPLGRASRTDDLADTVDYGAVYAAVAEEMAVPSDLLEHVCGRILRRVAADFPAFRALRVTVSKQHPPMGGPCAWSRVTLSQGYDA